MIKKGNQEGVDRKILSLVITISHHSASRVIYELDYFMDHSCQ